MAGRARVSGSAKAARRVMLVIVGISISKLVSP
jgi:hypothetical protein